MQSSLWALEGKLAEFLNNAAKTMQSNRGQGSREDFSLAILFAMNLFEHSGEFVVAKSRTWYCRTMRTSFLWVTRDRYLGRNMKLYQYPI